MSEGIGGFSYVHPSRCIHLRERVAAALFFTNHCKSRNAQHHHTGVPEKTGLVGLFGRGLRTRTPSNLDLVCGLRSQCSPHTNPPLSTHLCTHRTRAHNVTAQVIREDGLVGLFGRGLRTRILANAMQGMMFSVL